ncbi:MAG TPA: hypothetical protein DCL32_04990, partial [Gammaproteobacteria bacterium]|nr:hypothetical protein [Gammaproteobacteria bacterium]
SDLDNVALSALVESEPGQELRPNTRARRPIRFAIGLMVGLMVDLMIGLAITTQAQSLVP